VTDPNCCRKPGQTCNTAVLIDFSKYLHDIVELDPGRRLARVQPGCVLDTLRDRGQPQSAREGDDRAGTRGRGQPVRRGDQRSVRSGPSARLTPDRIAQLAPLLIDEANTLAERLGHRDHTRGAA